MTYLVNVIRNHQRGVRSQEPRDLRLCISGDKNTDRLFRQRIIFYPHIVQKILLVEKIAAVLDSRKGRSFCPAASVAVLICEAEIVVRGCAF